MPEGRIQIVTHHTPELVWQPRYQHQPNGAAALTGVLVCVDDPREAAERFSRFVGVEPVEKTDTWEMGLHEGRVVFIQTRRFGELYPDRELPCTPYIAEVSLRTDDLAATRRYFDDGGIRYETVGDDALRVAGAEGSGGVLSIPSIAGGRHPLSTDTRYDYDLFTIGAGSGGVRASRMSAVHGARVAVAEERYLGGTCVNVGCIPKKLLVYGSHFADDFEDAAGFGWTVGERAFDWPSLIRNKDQEIARLNSIYRSLLQSHGVELFESRARVLDPHTVEVGDRKVTAANILVATGGWPTVPNVPGREHAITSNEAFHLAEMPRRVVIVGGAYIAVEFAGIFNGLGAEVTQLYRGPLFMRGFDIDVRNTLAEENAQEGHRPPVRSRHRRHRAERREPDGHLERRPGAGDRCRDVRHRPAAQHPRPGNRGDRRRADP